MHGVTWDNVKGAILAADTEDQGNRDAKILTALNKLNLLLPTDPKRVQGWVHDLAELNKPQPVGNQPPVDLNDYNAAIGSLLDIVGTRGVMSIATPADEPR
jgi:hypothetical protein